MARVREARTNGTRSSVVRSKASTNGARDKASTNGAQSKTRTNGAQSKPTTNGARAFTSEDVGNVVSLEHVNVTQPEQPTAMLFYLVGMGFTRDPYMNVGLNNIWVNLGEQQFQDRKSTRLNSSHMSISYAVFCLKKKKEKHEQ